MSYYVRAFCLGPQTPSLYDVLEIFAEDQDINLDVGLEDDETLESLGWQNCELSYDENRSPIIVECNREDDVDDDGESLCRIECDEFIEDLMLHDASPARDRVIDHLRRCRFIIACELPDDIDDVGYAINGRFLHYYVERCGGLVQADGEGFYDDGDVIVETA